MNRAGPTHDGRRCNRHVPELRRCARRHIGGTARRAGDGRPPRTRRRQDAAGRSRSAPRRCTSIGSGKRRQRPSGRRPRARCRACGPMPTSVATAARSSRSCSRWSPSDRLQVRLQRGRQPGGLVRVDPQQPQRPDQLREVVGRRGDDDEPALRAAARGRSRARCAARTPRAPGRRRRRATGSRAQVSATTAIARGCAARRPAGRVPARSPAPRRRRPAARRAPRRGGGRCPRRDRAASPAAGSRHRVGQRPGDAGVVAGLEERDPVGHHLRRVPRRGAVTRREQGDVALPGPVEPWPAAHTQTARLRRQRGRADRAGQRGDRPGIQRRGAAHARGGTAWKVTSRSSPSAATAVT